jgi:hypothetical protein
VWPAKTNGRVKSQQLVVGRLEAMLDLSKKMEMEERQDER